MSFFSISFIIFLIITFFVYYMIPAKYRYVSLLIANYVFYISWNIKYAVILVLVTLISFFATSLMQKHNKKICLAAGVIALIITLLTFKYFNLISTDVCKLFGVSEDTIGAYKLFLPIGISFYILTSIGYMVDAYRGTRNLESNILRYATFNSFFPNILSGPIERSTNLLAELREEKVFSYEKVKKGLYYILWGYFLKLLVANRFAIIVDAAFDSYAEQTGATMLIIILFYGLQLYADFAGYSYIAIGIAALFGFSIVENFKQPYFARGIGDFWNRWHISLSSWLRDYVYIPLGGNRKGSVRKCINLMITFIVSGIWHGTGFRYIVWGIIHGVYQVFSVILKKPTKYVINKFHIKNECISFRLFEAIFTFILVDFAWLFFRAPSAREAVIILKNIFANFQLGVTLSENLYLVGFDLHRFFILLIELITVLFVDIVREKKISIYSWMNKQNKAFRWTVYIGICMVIFIGIIYDYGIEASSFIYTQF